MTRTKHGVWGTALFGLIAGACWFAALLAAGRLAEQYGGLSVRFPAAAVTRRDLVHAVEASLDGELGCTAAWTRGSERKTASSGLGERTLLRMIFVYGDMRQIAPMKLLAGNFPVDDDMSGCVIDGASAWELFHAIDAIGAEVILEGENYIVRGVVEAYEPMALLRNRSAAYENLEFAARDLSAAKQRVETFLYRCNSAGGKVIVQSGLLARLTLSFVWLLPCILGFAGAVAMFRSGWRAKGKKRGGLPFLVAGMALAVAAGVVLIKTAYWPQSFLPTKWSDFEFWPDLIIGWETQWKAISLMTPLPKEIELFRTIRSCGVLLWTALLMSGLCASSLRFQRNKERH